MEPATAKEQPPLIERVAHLEARLEDVGRQVTQLALRLNQANSRLRLLDGSDEPPPLLADAPEARRPWST